MLTRRLRLCCTLLSLLSLSALAADSSGRFVHPKNNSQANGPLLISVQAADTDGLARVFVRLQPGSTELELCPALQPCNGTAFRATTGSVDPAALGVSPGLLPLQLWVTDNSGQSSLVAESEVSWQPPVNSGLQVRRSNDGRQIELSWQQHPAVLRYNLYLASAAGVNRSNYRQWPDGQARLAVKGPAETFSGLAADKTYYLRLSALQGSGESWLGAEVAVPSPLQQPNRPPVAVADSYQTTTNQSLQISAALGLLANDSDADGDALTVAATPVTAPLSGSVTLAADGSFSYIPNNGFSGTDSFRYQINDGKGGTAQATVTVELRRVISNITGNSQNISGDFLYIGQGEDPAGSQIGTGLYRIGDCVRIVDTRCTMQGRYTEAAQSGNVPGQQGNFSFVLIYPGLGVSPVLAKSAQPNSNSVQFVNVGQARFELSLFPDNGGKYTARFPASPFADSLNFSAFIQPSASCSGLPAGLPCSIGQVGRVAGAQIQAPLDRLSFTIPGSALDDPGPQPPTATADQYSATAGQTLNVATPGVLQNDREARALPQGDLLTIRQSVNPGLGALVALSANEYQQGLYLYPSFATAIQRTDRLGITQGSLSMQGEAANDVDLDIAAQSFRLKDSQIPQGSLLIFNGETASTEVYAVDPASGALLARLDTAFGASHVVGGAYNPVSRSLWLLQDNVPPAGIGNMVAQIDPLTGQVLSSFSLVTAQHNYPVSFGDLHINPHNGNLLLVSSIQSTMAEFDRSGTLLRLLPLPAGVSNISGLAISADGTLLWLASTSGTLHELAFANQGVLPTLSARLLSGPGNGSVQLKPDGSFSYTPASGFSGQDRFTYQLNGAFGSSEASVVINVP